MAYNYAKTRAKMCISLADHCHDKALEALSPAAAAQWIGLMDTLLWCATEDGDTSTLLTMFEKNGTPE